MTHRPDGDAAGTEVRIICHRPGGGHGKRPTVLATYERHPDGAWSTAQFEQASQRVLKIRRPGGGRVLAGDGMKSSLSCSRCGDQLQFSDGDRYRRALDRLAAAGPEWSLQALRTAYELVRE